MSSKTPFKNIFEQRGTTALKSPPNFLAFAFSKVPGDARVRHSA